MPAKKKPAPIAPATGAEPHPAGTTLPHSPYLIISRGRNGTFCVATGEGSELLSDFLLTEVEAVAVGGGALAAEVAAWASQPKPEEYPA